MATSKPILPACICAGLGPDVNFQIEPSLANKIENDANRDKLTDIPRDVGGALQTDFDVAAGGGTSVAFFSTFGLNDIISGTAVVSEWTLYEFAFVNPASV